MAINKREFLKLSGVATGAALLGSCAPGRASSPPKTRVPATAASPLSSLIAGVTPISIDERKARVQKAQRLMSAAGLDAVIIEPGSSMIYFSGIRWWRSERPTLLVLPREGEIAVITPFFEAPSVRESMTFGEDVRTWHEHENPFERVSGILQARGISGRRVGLEATLRYFIVEGLQAQGGVEVTSGQSVVDGCRMFKSAHEIELMKKANEITLRAYAHVYQALEAGMRSADIKSLMASAQTALGGSKPWGLALIGSASAYPHGSKLDAEVQEGELILMDCGCAVEGYQSDISRTFVFGEASKDQRAMWTQVREGQEVAFQTAILGSTAGSVDDAVRRYYESLGYGPDYQTPGLSHRTGHGIGMDGHENTNLVRGNATKLAPGMCFSNEPGIYDFAKFGVRLEDCIYMSKEGAQWFTVPPDTIDDPIGSLG